MWMNSTEILSEEILEWEIGPDLPFGIVDTALVEDQSGANFTCQLVRSAKQKMCSSVLPIFAL